MKKPLAVWAGFASILGLIFILHAQETATTVQSGAVSQDVNSLSDLQVMLQAIESVPPAPAASAPRGSTFYSAQHAPGTRLGWPGLPENSRQLPVWNLGDGVYLLDDLQVDYSTPLMSSRMAGGMMMDGMSPSGGGDEDYEYSFTPPIYTADDLWLEITGTTNIGINLTAALVIHPPWNMTNGVWGLYFKTNLAIPYGWTWLLRNAPGQTNLIVTNLPPVQGFFMLGSPTAIRPGFTNNSLAPNDDDYCCGVRGDGEGGYPLLTNLLATLPFSVNFFGTSYTNLFVNNNGNVTFDTNLDSYTPTDLLNLVTNNFANNIAPTNIIAPFWADVDTRSSGVTAYGTNTVDGRAAFGVSWIDVGYFNAKYDKTNSFQMVLIDRSDRTNGDFDLEFNYSQIQWEAGDFSGGCDGLWTGRAPRSDCGEQDNYGSSARVGYASANGSMFGSTFELNGSAVPRAFVDTNMVTGLIHTNFNSTVPGRYVFQFHNGVPLGHP